MNMKRLIDLYLADWRFDPHKKPLLLRGARQVGKTFAARTFGASFEHFIEINFEQYPQVASVFASDLNAHRIVRDLELILKKPISAGRSLLFFDEIQSAPNAIRSLRYFYEQIPDLHVIAAGSLLEFQLESIGMPVGRIQSLYLYPLSFLEFLAAQGEIVAISSLADPQNMSNLSLPLHTRLLALWGEYIAVGGMPEAVNIWSSSHSLDQVCHIHRSIVETYRQDFEKYAKGGMARYVPLLFDKIPWLQGKKFKYTHISDALKKRELAPALELLEKAGIVHRIMHSSAQGLPLMAQVNPDIFKLQFIDVGLGQALLGPGQEKWILDPAHSCINKGEIAEAFAGQELIAYADPDIRPALYYWLREVKSSHAEVDYLYVQESAIVPLEIKSGATGTLKSQHLFLKEHPASAYGIRLYAGMPDLKGPIRSYPLFCSPLLFLKPSVFARFAAF